MVKKVGFGDDLSCGERGVDEEKPGYCLTTSEDFDEIVLVVGNTRNTPAPNLNFTGDNDLKKILSGVFFNTELDGIPRINIISVARGNSAIGFNNKNRPAKNISASNNKLKNLSKGLSKAINTPPINGGADYIGGILYAKDIISSDSKNPLILIVGSGYNDSGVLDFTKDDVLNKAVANESFIIDRLSQNRTVKEGMLSGVSIYWYNLGEVADPQDDMDAYKEILKSIYKDAFEYLGAKKVDLNRNVAIVGESRSIESPYTVQQVYVNELKSGDVFEIPESIGEFQPGSNTLKTPRAELEHTIGQFASRFNPNSNLKMVVTGYTFVGPGAGCPTDGQLALSRAEVIRDILVGLGIPYGKIEVYGEKGAPTESGSYTCENILPESEQRTVKIKVVPE